MTLFIDRNLLKHLASLSRLSLDVKEVNKFMKDFSKIIDHFQQLKKINTENIEPMIGGANSKNILREDNVDLDKRVQSVNDSGHIIKAFPESERGYLKIPPVFE